jgi:Ca2+-binding RTX toxin-like protein
MMRTDRRRRAWMRWLGALMVVLVATCLTAGVASATDSGAGNAHSCDHLPPPGAKLFRGRHVIHGHGRFHGTPGDDFIVGSPGPDVIHAEDGDNIVCAGGGNDVIYGGDKGDDLHGQNGDDKIFGGILDDTLYGEGGDDLIVGGHGADQMYGGPGSDWMRGGTTRDVFDGGDPGNDDAGGPDAVDVASFADVTPSSNHFPGFDGIAVNLTGTPQGDLPPHSARGDGDDTVLGIESVIASPFDDRIWADGVKDPKLFGGMGTDTCSPVPCSEPAQELQAPFVYLDTDTPFKQASPDPMLIAVGGAGSETFTLAGRTITASAPLNTFGCDQPNGPTTVACRRDKRVGGGVAWFGGDGNDTMTVGNAFGLDKTVDLDGGKDSDTITGNDGGETLYSGDSGADTLLGKGGEDALIAEGAGPAHLDAGAGNDQLVTTDPCQGNTLIGGRGADIAGFARTGFPIHAQLGGVAYMIDGYDPGRSDADNNANRCPNAQTTRVSRDNEILEGTQASDILIGSSRNDTIWGRVGNDLIEGLGGDDTLEGMQNDDTIDGGPGIDTLLGGPDSDALRAKDDRRDERVDCGPGKDKPLQADRGRRADPVVNCEGWNAGKPAPKPHKGKKPSRPKPPRRPSPAKGRGKGHLPPKPAPPAPGKTPTQAFVTVDQTLNGQPGWVTVHGHVLGGSAPLNGVYVNVNFQKQQPNGDWETMSSAHPVLVNGAYQVDGWRVAVGQWRVRTVLPEQGTLAEAVSDYRGFGIGRGYQLVNRHSGLCLTISQDSAANGSPILQWPCGAGPGQVLTMVPVGGGFHELAFNATGKCLDVTGVSLADGALLQEWACLGPGQANQLWQAIPIAGQPGWWAFAAAHSGKCADVLGARTNNGARVGQWACNWAGNQQWSIQGVG